MLALEIDGPARRRAHVHDSMWWVSFRMGMTEWLLYIIVLGLLYLNFWFLGKILGGHVEILILLGHTDDEMADVVCYCFSLAEGTHNFILDFQITEWGKFYVSWSRVMIADAHVKQGWWSHLRLMGSMGSVRQTGHLWVSIINGYKFMGVIMIGVGVSEWNGRLLELPIEDWDFKNQQIYSMNRKSA